MEIQNLIYIFQSSLDANLRQHAEEELARLKLVPNFSITILNIVVKNDLVIPIRQAAAIFLKRQIESSWEKMNQDEGFVIAEEEKNAIRKAIVFATVNAPDNIKPQLASCVHNILKHEPYEKLTPIIESILEHLNNPESSCWYGAVLCLLELIKRHKFQTVETSSFFKTMQMILPLLLERLMQLLSDHTEYSARLQKLILKSYCNFIQFNFASTFPSIKMFDEWIDVCHLVLDRELPVDAYNATEELPCNLPWWMCKKWALHVLYRIFELYENSAEFSDGLAERYVNLSAYHTMELLLKIFDRLPNGKYVCPRVLQESFEYLERAVGIGHCWKFLKKHMPNIITRILFPVLCFTEADEALWKSDPSEYIRLKFDAVEDCRSPVSAASVLLQAACVRKTMLKGTVQFMLEIVNNNNCSCKEKDGAMHMLGSLSHIMMKKSYYNQELDDCLARLIFPELQNPIGLLRIRAFWVLHKFSNIKFKQEPLLMKAVEMTAHAVLNDLDIPVKIQAAGTLNMLLSSQPRAIPLLEPQVKPLSLELLKFIQNWGNDEVLNALQVIVKTYSNQLTDLTVEICRQLVNSLKIILDSPRLSENEIIQTVGFLNTIDSLLSVVLDNREILSLLHSDVLQVVHTIFSKRIDGVFDGVFTIIASLTTNFIFPEMWLTFEHIYKVFQNDGLEFFSDAMPALHNFITVDTESFLSNENHLIAIFEMCKAVLSSGAGNNYDCYAAKLLEVIILQCKGRVDQCLPSFIDLMIHRMARETPDVEVRTMCLQVIVAAFHTNPSLFFECMGNIQSGAGDSESMETRFVTELMKNVGNLRGLHDRKMCVLALCQLISLPKRPQVVQELSRTIIPTLITLLESLLKLYGAKNAIEEKEKNLENQASQDSSNDDVESISSDEDYSLTNEAENDDCESESEGETALESYSTPLDLPECEMDEFCIFQEVLGGLQATDPAWYYSLTCNLTTEQKDLMEVIFIQSFEIRADKKSRRNQGTPLLSFPNQGMPTFKFSSP